MIAIDTNILIRLLTDDDNKQAKIAADLLNNNKALVSNTVLIETEWVLRYTYKLDDKKICSIFKQLLKFHNIVFEDCNAISQAIIWYQQGFDFADALHLITTNDKAVAFITFDKKLVNKSNKFNIPIDVKIAG